MNCSWSIINEHLSYFFTAGEIQNSAKLNTLVVGGMLSEWGICISSEFHSILL